MPAFTGWRYYARWQRKKNTLFYHFLRIRLSSIRLKRCGRILNGRYGKLRRDTLACWKCYWVFLILFNYKIRIKSSLKTHIAVFRLPLVLPPSGNRQHVYSSTTTRAFSGWTGRLLSCPIISRIASSCSLLAETGCLKTTQFTPSLHGGVVSEPLRR